MARGQKKEAGDLWFGNFNGFLNQAAIEENTQRETLHKQHPLAIYYPEPTTLYNDTARRMMRGAKDGQSEGMKMIVSLVNTLNFGDVRDGKKLPYLKYDSRMTTTTSTGARSDKLYQAYKGVVSRMTKNEGQKESFEAELAEHDAQSSYAVSAKDMIGRYKAHGLKV